MPIDNVPEPRFDLDFQRGRQAELWVGDDIREALIADRIEVKRDDLARRTGNIYVEYECLRRGQWRPSGIQTTESQLWIFVIEMGKLAIVIELEKLKDAARKAAQNGGKRECLRGSHPTRGVAVPMRDLLNPTNT